MRLQILLIITALLFSVQVDALEVQTALTVSDPKAKTSFLVIDGEQLRNYPGRSIPDEKGVRVVAELAQPGERSLVSVVTELEDGQVVSTPFRPVRELSDKGDRAHAAQREIDRLRKEISLIDQEYERQEKTLRIAEQELRARAGYGAVDQLIAQIQELDRKLAQ